MTQPTNPPRRRRWRESRWRSILLDAAIVLAVMIGIRAYQQRGLPSGPAPAVEGVALDGTKLSIADLRGQPVMLHFWATWCSVCSMEKGSVQALAGGKRVVTVAASSGDAAKVGAYMRGQNLSFPVIVDPEGELAHRFGVGAFPTTLFLDKRGDIRFAEVGYTTELGMRARLWLAGLFGS